MKNTHGKIDKRQMLELEKQINNLENCIGILQHKLQSKQKVLKQLQNHQNLVNLLYYNILSKEKDREKIQESFNQLLSNINLVVKKLPSPTEKKKASISPPSSTLTLDNQVATPTLTNLLGSKPPADSTLKTIEPPIVRRTKNTKNYHFQDWLKRYTQKTTQNSQSTAYHVFYSAYLLYLHNHKLSVKALTKSGFTKALNQENLIIFNEGGTTMIKAQIK